jgi:hypothetical protein
MRYVRIRYYSRNNVAKGINISINHTHKHEQPEPKKEEEQKYNPSMVGYLPAEVQQYYQQTNGQNRF